MDEVGESSKHGLTKEEGETLLDLLSNTFGGMHVTPLTHIHLYRPVTGILPACIFIRVTGLLNVFSNEC